MVTMDEALETLRRVHDLASCARDKIGEIRDDGADDETCDEAVQHLVDIGENINRFLEKAGHSRCLEIFPLSPADDEEETS